MSDVQLGIHGKHKLTFFYRYTQSRMLEQYFEEKPIYGGMQQSAGGTDE